MRAFVVGGALLALAASATPVAAQTEFGVTASFYSAYVWRGLSLTNKPVLQPDVSLAFPLGGASLTVGGWGNVELGAYDGEDDITQGGGTSLNLSEFDPYAEIGFSAGKAEIAIGGIGYIYPNDDDAPANSDINTFEVYGTIGLGVPLNPTLAVYYDVSKVKGLYVEGSVSHDIPLGPKALTLGALVGYSSNMKPSADDESANFSDDGLTHVDLSAEIELSAGPFSITPTVHGIFGIDDWTKISKATATDTKFKVWGGVSISWGKSFGKVEEE
jgi:uncharacterized protein (TIGR02001 family)